MNKRILGTILMGASLALGIVMLPGSASAQGTLRYQTRYSKADVSRIIAKLEASSNTFRNDFDTAMDRSNLNGTAEEDRFNRYVGDFAGSMDRLRSNFDRNSSWWEARNDVQTAIQRAQPVNDMMNTISFRRNLERQWNSMRNDLNTLADTFDLPGLNGGGWTGGGNWNNGNNGNWNGGRQGNVPSWAQGTFYARNPETGGVITLNIASNGTVNISFDGNPPIYASMNGTTLTNGQYVSRVSRTSNGIRTTDVNNRSYIDYSRTAINGGWNGGNNGNWNGGQQGNVPSWAQGTFYGRNPETGGVITLNIASNGTVNISFDGNTPVYASMNGTTLTNGQYVSRVTRTSNGIRTTDVNNRSYIDYSRTPIGGGGWSGNTGNNGRQGNVPNWAVGTFYGRNPENGGTISLSIRNDGSVVISFDGQNAVYASVYGTTLTNGQYVSRLSKINNGIRTTDVNNGSYIDYFRR